MHHGKFSCVAQLMPWTVMHYSPTLVCRAQGACHVELTGCSSAHAEADRISQSSAASFAVISCCVLHRSRHHFCRVVELKYALQSASRNPARPRTCPSASAAAGRSSRGVSTKSTVSSYCVSSAYPSTTTLYCPASSSVLQQGLGC